MQPNPIILINGPAGSGKDMFAKFICRLMLGSQVTNQTYRFAEFNKDHLVDVLLARGVSRPEQIDYYMGREGKDKPTDILNGMTPREYEIKFAEEFIKSLFGKSFYALNVINRINEFDHWNEQRESPYPAIHVVVDLGFREELLEFVDKKDRVTVASIRRDGLQWNESRRDLEHLAVNKGFNVVEIDNNGTLDDLKDQANKLIDLVQGG